MKTKTFIVSLLFLPVFALDALEPPSLYDIPVTVTLPAVVNGNPGAGKRVRMTTPGWTETSVYHTLYLPKDWSRNVELPVIVEYAGNGGYVIRCYFLQTVFLSLRDNEIRP